MSFQFRKMSLPQFVRKRDRPIPVSADDVFSPTNFSTPGSYVNLPSFDSLIELGLTSDISEVTKDEILYVSEKITKWQLLLRNLFDDADEDVDHLIADLEDEKNSKSLKLQDVTARALQEWKKRSGKKARFEKLAWALRKIGRTDLCERLDENRNLPGSLYKSRRSAFSSYGSLYSNPKNCSNDVGSPVVCYHNGSLSSAHSFVHLPYMEDFSDGPFCYSDDPICFKVVNEQRLPEIEELQKALNDPSKKIISLAGHVNSGKTIILDILHREIKSNPAFERMKIIKIDLPDQRDVQTVTRKTIECITKEPQLEGNYAKSVKKHLTEILETDAYDDIVLILDISLIPISQNGQKIVQFLNDLIQEEKLLGKLTIIVSSLCSLSNSKLFMGSRRYSHEVIVRAMGHEEAVKFMIAINDTFSRRAATNICNKIECVPFLLKSIAETDIKNFFAVESKEELLKAIDCKLGDLLENICCSFEGKSTIKSIFDCLGDDQKSLLAQVLTFSSEFDVERAARVVDSRLHISDMSFNCFCEKGALFFSSKAIKISNSKVYTIPAMLGKLLRSVIQEDTVLYGEFQEAEKRHQNLYHNLLLYMSSCFMGDTPNKSEELRMLEPFTPSDGVPAKFSLTINDMDERVKRVVSLFRDHLGDIKNSLKVSSNSDEKYQAAISVATNLHVYYLFSKLLRFHEALEIYRNMKRKARSYANLDTEKLNVFIAAFHIDAYGSKWFSSEAKSLLEAASTPLKKELSKGDVTANFKDIYAHCLCKFGTCLMAESLMNKEGESGEMLSQGIGFIRSSIGIFEEDIGQRCCNRAYIADNNLILAGCKYELEQYDEALEIINNSCRSQSYGRNHPLSCNCRRLQGMIYRKQEKFDCAKSTLLEVFDAEQQLIGEHSDTARTLHELGLCNLYEYYALDEEASQNTIKAPAPHERRLLPDLGGLNGNCSDTEQDNSGNYIAHAKEKIEDRHYIFDVKVSCRCGLNCEGICLNATANGAITRDSLKQDGIGTKKYPVHFEEDTRDRSKSKEKVLCNCGVNCQGNCLQTEDQFVLLRFNSSSTASLHDSRHATGSNPQSPADLACASRDRRDTLKADIGRSLRKLEGEGPTSDLLIEAKSYFKKAARYSLHVVGKRDDACANLEYLAEVCGLLGDDEEKQKWLERVKEYREWIVR